MFSPLRILYHFWIWPIPSYLKEPPCTLRTHSVDRIQHYTLWWNKNKYECLVGYNFRSTQGRPTNLHPNEGLRSPLFEYHIIFEFDQFRHTLKSLHVHRALLQVAGVLSGNKSTLPCEEIKINMNVWLDITSPFFKGGRQIYIQMKAMFSPLRILYHFWIWPIPSYLKEPPCTLRTHSVETIQHYTLWRNKNKYECLVGYNFRSTQGRPTNLHPNEGLGSSLFEYHIICEFAQFLHTLKSLRVHRALLQVAGVLSGNKSTLPCEEIKINMNVWFDITSEVFKGGRQIYIQMKAYVLPFKNIISFLNLANSFIP